MAKVQWIMDNGEWIMKYVNALKQKTKKYSKSLKVP
jgi:hypothetical protein